MKESEMEESKQKPLRNAASNIKDFVNTYIKQEEKAHSAHDTANTVDINDVHTHADDKSIEVTVEEALNSESERRNNEVVEELALQIARIEKERDELKDQLIRKVAEFENFRKRTEREKDELRQYGSEKVLAKFVEILDNLRSAVEQGQKSSDYTSLLKGVDMTFAVASKLFDEAGVKAMAIEPGAPFDVNMHEALMHIPSEVEEGCIVQELMKGYTIHDKVLRHAKVITSAGKSE